MTTKHLLFLFATLASTALAQEVVTDPRAMPPGLSNVTPPVPPTFALLGYFDAGNTIIMPTLDVATLLDEDRQAGFGPLRMGVRQDTPSGPAAEGRWQQLPDGRWTWTLAVSAPGAQALRLKFDLWSRPSGAELIVFNPHSLRNAFGPLDGLRSHNKSHFWTPIIFSNEARIEYTLPLGLEPTGDDAVPHLTEVLNVYRSMRDDDPTSILDCHLDWRCYDSWEFVGQGVGPISTIGNKYGFFCSASMTISIDGGFKAPMLSTARHCGVDGSNDDDLLVLWNYAAQTCNGGNPPDFDDLVQTQGVVLLVNDAATDYTLVGMKWENLGGITFQGWSSGHWADNSAARGIHHARGSYRRITFGEKQDDVNSCVDGDAWYIFNPDGNGEIEPGSSGSPIFDSNQRARGVASCASWACDADNFATYGRFDNAYSNGLKWFLNSVDPIYIDKGNNGAEEGSETRPFDTVIEGVYAVAESSTINIVGGNYNERMTIEKPMTLKRKSGLVKIGAP